MLTGSGILIYWLIVLGVAIIASAIHAAIVEGFDFLDVPDFFDTYFTEHAWITFLIVGILGAIVFGFLNWLWWAMLLILLGPIVLVIILIVVFHLKDKKDDKIFEENAKKKTEAKETTAYNCPNCGARIVKTTITDLNGNEETRYSCEHCNTVFNKKQMVGITDSDFIIEPCDLDDWEEEYFRACIILNFKAHNHHSEAQLDRRVESIQDKIYSCDFTYDDDEEDDDDILNSGYDFFIENIDEIEEYLKNTSKEEIQKRFKYYCFINEEDDEE